MNQMDVSMFREFYKRHRLIVRLGALLLAMFITTPALGQVTIQRDVTLSVSLIPQLVDGDQQVASTDSMLVDSLHVRVVNKMEILLKAQLSNLQSTPHQRAQPGK